MTYKDKLKALDGITENEWKELKKEIDMRFEEGKVQGIKVDEAARIMGKSPQFIRVGLQQGKLPFGHAIKVTGNKYAYYISPKLFTEYVGEII